jgi:hypothetical protein
LGLAGSPAQVHSRIDLSICELDGAAVTEAARRPVYYWPE